MIRIDAIWLATEPMDMRAGTETALARVIAVFGAAKPHCAYLFAMQVSLARRAQWFANGARN
ncbi:ISPpu14, transposase Orf2 [Pseudomonas syringae pv. actinidiae ICMP 19099]|nr:ISPpu14, transposase Orf2 [Pseudomonas syringae pv. actinidiae ICMP 19099]